MYIYIYMYILFESKGNRAKLFALTHNLRPLALSLGLELLVVLLRIFADNCCKPGTVEQNVLRPNDRSSNLPSSSNTICKKREREREREKGKLVESLSFWPFIFLFFLFAAQSFFRAHLTDWLAHGPFLRLSSLHLGLQQQHNHKETLQQYEHRTNLIPAARHHAVLGWVLGQVVLVSAALPLTGSNMRVNTHLMPWNPD